MSKPLSWKWKIILTLIVLAFVLLGWIFTPGCDAWVQGKINQEFAALPESERRDSQWAGWYLFWAAFKGNVCGDYKSASGMYKDFCGLPMDYNKRAFDFVLSPAFKRMDAKNGFVGKCSPNGLLGWGPMHPDAPDAYYNYICMIESNEVGATTGREALVYYMLFYDWHMKHSADHKPHPKFQKYWEKIRQKTLDSRVGFSEIPNFDYLAKQAPPWKEP